MISESGRSGAISRLLGLATSPIVGLSASALFWSGNFIVGRALRDSIAPLSLNFWRWTIALVFLLPLTYRQLLRHRSLIRRHWKFIVVLGLTGIAAFQTCVYVALTTTSAINALLLLSLSPLLIVLISWSVLREPISLPQLLGVVVAFLGAVALIARGSVDALAALRVSGGDLWMMLAALLWAVYSLVLRRRPANLPQLVLLTTSAIAGVLAMLPAFLWLQARGYPFTLDQDVLWGLLYVSLFASVLAFFFWNHGVSKIGANQAGVFLYLMPVFGAVLAVIFLGEGLHLYQFGGGILIFLGIGIMNWRSAA